MNKKIKHKVIVEKHDRRNYIVKEFTFDTNGDTVNMQCHPSCTFKEAHALRREILAAYELA